MATTTTRWNDSPEAAHAERPHSGRRWARLRLRRQAVRGTSKHNYATRRCAMTLPYDDDPKFTAYAHPERLVSTSWLATSGQDRKSTRLNSSHVASSYAVLSLKK